MLDRVQALSPPRRAHGISSGPGAALAHFVVGAAVAGVAVVVLPPLQALVVAGGAFVLLGLSAVAVRGWSDVEIYAGLVIVASSFVDLPRNVVIGPATALAGLSFIYAVGATLIRLNHSRTHPSKLLLRPLWLFVIWAILSALRTGSDIKVMQQLSVAVMFVATAGVVAAAAPARFGFIQRMGNLLVLGALVSTGLYGVGVILGGLGGEFLIGSRTYALFALMTLAWSLASFRYGNKFALLVTLITLAGIFTSLSRLALGAALVLVVLAWFKLTSLMSILRALTLLGIGSFLMINAISNIDALNERFLEGDVLRVGGGLAVNVSGRANLWGVTWDSFMESPWIGKGPGSAEDAVSSRFPEVAHPHNDYLKLLHDYGIIGGALFLFGFFRLMLISRRRWAVADRIGDREGARLHLAAFLALVATALAMITDNSLAYVFQMAPLAVMVGMSLSHTNSPKAAA